MRFKFKHTLYSLMTALFVTAVTLAASISQSHAQNYDIDCKVILCLAGGFSSGCGDAKSYMYKRLKKGKSPFGFCSMSNGAEYKNYSAPASFINDYDCPAGTRLFNGRTNTGGRDDGQNKAFCYVSSSIQHVGGREGGPQTVYTGVQAAIPVNFQIQITIEPGTEHEFRSDIFRINTTTGYVSQRPAL